jgi:hypothetical protein
MSNAGILLLEAKIDTQNQKIATLTNDLEKLKAVSAKQLDEANAAVKAANAAAKTANLRVTMTGHLIKAGVSPDAIEDMVRRAEAAGEWETDPSGHLRRRDEAGRWHEDIAKFVEPLKATLPGYFADGAGSASNNDTPTVSGGTNGGGNTAVTGRANPWSREGWSDAGQVAAWKKDPVEAEKLAEAAGSRIGALNPP